MLRLFKIGGDGAARSREGSLHPKAEEAALLDSLNDAVLTSDTSECITYANRAALDLFDCDRDELLGESLLNLFTRECRDIVRFAQSAARDGLAQRYDAQLVGGDERTVSISASPLG